MREASPDTAITGGPTPWEGCGRVLARIFTALGGQVVHHARAENSVCLVDSPGLHMWTHRVEVEGVPNLAHEIGHLLFEDRLDDDHGLDYSAIPYDLKTKHGRRVLAEELVCCALSCSVLAQLSMDRGINLESQEVICAVDAWFAEQIEIQPVFYQSEIDLDVFRSSVDVFVRSERDTLVRKCDYLYAKLAEWMPRIGVSLDRNIQVRYEVHELWLIYLMRDGVRMVKST